MSEKILFSIGNIIKKESLISVDFNEQCKSMVLESDQPYPGYHGPTLPKSEPDSLYLVLKATVKDDDIIRAIQKVKKNNDLHFDGAPGTVMVNNKNETVIRIKHASYDEVPRLIQLFKDQGHDFAKYRRIKPFESLINIRKYFKTKEITEDIFHDTENPSYYYIKIPFLPRWDDFENITKKIKYNVDDNNFDAALCSMYNEEGLIDFVRIYDEHFDTQKMLYIKDKYCNEINKL